MLQTGVIVAAATEGATTGVTEALKTVVQLATDGMSIITGNPVLMILFCASLMSVGFGVITAAKHAARG